MSLDNVIAIAAAADGNMALLVLGLAISIPLIVAGAALIMSLLDRFPMLVWAGAALLGWIAGEVIATDPVVTAATHPPFRRPRSASGRGRRLDPGALSWCWWPAVFGGGQG